MFEDQQPTQAQNPLNPIMPAPGMTPPPATGLTPPPPLQMPQVHTMPERFRAANTGGSGKAAGPRSTRRLVIILTIVAVVAGLGVAGLYVFQNVLNSNTENTNLVVTNRVNINQNTNSTLNQNGNANENTNVAANDNANTNTVANTNTTTNTNTTVTATPLPSSADADSDGLTDVEEAVYGTDAAKADTDGDGFIDGKQIRSDGTIVGEFYLGYNPKGTGSLETSGLMKRQQDNTSTYSILLPTSWTATADANGGILINPSQASGEFFQASINDNATRLAPKDWYRANNPSANVDALTTFAVNGLEGIFSEDASTAYLFKDAKVYSLHYDPGALTQVNYRLTFEVMVRSFKLVAS